MTEEEVIEVNAQIILEHLDKIEYRSKVLSNEYVSHDAAAMLTWASDSKIVDVTSKLYEDGGLVLTVVDEKGETYIVSIGAFGSVAAIEDIDGNYLYNSPY